MAMHPITRKVHVVLRKLAQMRAAAWLRSHDDLAHVLDDYIERSRSTGCNPTDYWTLYREIRAHRPREVLECGTGVSTLVIAQALIENERETGVRGRVTSMEEIPEWLEMARKLLPARYEPYVDFRASPTVEDRFSMFRGVRYRDVPERAYDYVFVDGPKYVSPEDGTPTFDFDLLHVLRTAEAPVSGLVDKRVSTCFVLQQVLGTARVRYSPVLHLGFVGPCTRASLGSLATRLSSADFEESFALAGTTRLGMRGRARQADRN